MQTGQNVLGKRPAETGKSKLVLDLASTELRAGNPGEAQRLLQDHVFHHPGDAAVLARLGELALEDGRIEQATVWFRRAALSEPTLARRMHLIDHLFRHAGTGAALAELETLPPAMRAQAGAVAKEAALLGVLGVHDRQIALYEQLSRLWPNNPTVWMSLGNALKTVGRMDEAVAALRQAIAVEPTYGEGYWTLANFKRFQFTDDDIAAMKAQLKTKLSDLDALHFHFSLGKAFEDRNQFEPSFRHYAAGNKIRFDMTKPTSASITNYVDSSIRVFNAGLYAGIEGFGCDSPDPIFVIGLHRSGSTLIEQILASHPDIEGTNELTVIQQIWDRIARAGGRLGRNAWQHFLSLPRSELRAMGQEYLERTRPFRLTDKPMFVDKQPTNWLHAGFIRAILPNAKIVDARRHPMACGFSNFKQNYASGVTFSYSQETIGAFYRDYCRFMAHLDAVQPGKVHRVLNESLIDDPEGETRALLDYVGVAFDPACLDFHTNTRAVRTPSAEQVRRPINRDGVDYWRHYEPWLKPLKQALGPALERWNQGPRS